MSCRTAVPNPLASGTSFMEDNFSTEGRVGGMVRRGFQFHWLLMSCCVVQFLQATEENELGNPAVGPHVKLWYKMVF